MTEQEYIRQLEQVIARFLQPLRDIPFPIVIRALYGFEVLSFDQNERRNRGLLKMLIQAAEISGRRAHQEGIFARRPNEAGNKIEPYVKELAEIVEKLNNSSYVKSHKNTLVTKIRHHYKEASRNFSYFKMNFLSILLF